MLIKPTGTICNHPYRRGLGLLAQLISQSFETCPIQMPSSTEQFQKNVPWLGLTGVGGGLKWNNT